jgi:hypothetical protein
VRSFGTRGPPAKAFEWLDRTPANRDSGIQNLLFDSFLLRYKDDPRFAAFCKKAGLLAPSRREKSGSKVRNG